MFNTRQVLALKKCFTVLVALEDDYRASTIVLLQQQLLAHCAGGDCLCRYTSTHYDTMAVPCNCILNGCTRY